VVSIPKKGLKIGRGSTWVFKKRPGDRISPGEKVSDEGEKRILCTLRWKEGDLIRE